MMGELIEFRSVIFFDCSFVIFSPSYKISGCNDTENQKTIDR